MIGAIITLSIISFVLLCTATVSTILYRSEMRSNSWTQQSLKNYEHTLDRLTEAIEDVGDYLNRDKTEQP